MAHGGQDHNPEFARSLRPAVRCKGVNEFIYCIKEEVQSQNFGVLPRLIRRANAVA